jgi:hypothetical protein
MHYVVAVCRGHRRVCGCTEDMGRAQRVAHDLNWLLHKRRDLCAKVFFEKKEAEELKRRTMLCTKELLYLDPEWNFPDEPMRYEVGGVHSYDRNPPRFPPVAGTPVPPPVGQPDFDEISLGSGPYVLGG